jgi:pectate lyase
MANGSKCIECHAPIAKFIGMKRPGAQVTKTSDGGDGEVEWTVEDMEDLATAAANTNKVSVIHFVGDRVPSLHSSRTFEAQARQAWMELW